MSVLSHDEALAVINHMRGVPCLMTKILYGSGLHLIECLYLRVKDTDFEDHQIIVRGGKGDNDRLTILPESVAYEIKHILQDVKAMHELWALLAPLLGFAPDQLTQGQMTYHLHRLRLQGLIERILDTHRYQVTEFGWRVALFFTHTYARLIRPGLAQIVPNALPTNSRLQHRFNHSRLPWMTGLHRLT